MAKQPTDCSEFDPNALSVDQALARILDTVKPIQDTVHLEIQPALHHVLAQDITSPINVPPYANSAMDGYAVRSNDLPEEGTTTLTLAGTSWAGAPFQGQVNQGECIRIMTGAKMPDGADTVIMQEQVDANDTVVTIGSGHIAKQNVRYAGEDISAGKVVLSSGNRLGPAEIGLLASLGIARVTVYRPLRIAFFSTGDELRAVGEELEEGQIYDSNRYTLSGMLQEQGVEIIDMGVIRDDRNAIEDAFKQAASQADAVITTGGVSVGEADFVKETLEKLGKVSFWKISMKPGRPLAFGQLGNAFFFGLPGNPVSVMATFYEFALPALKLMMGQSYTPTYTFKAKCVSRLKKRPGRTDFQRGILSYNENNELVVDGAGMQASHILSGMSRANCFIVLAADAGDIEAGTIVDVQPFTGLQR